MTIYRPTDEADLGATLTDAQTPFQIRGGGTRSYASGNGATVLETGALTGVTLYEPAALTLVARAGTPLSEIEATLAAENQRLAFEPMDHRALLGTSGVPTLGGVIAANVSGPRRVQVGAARDFMLGVRFVDGGGRVLSNGGRVMKNVTGYDLVKLMTGSHGTLGVLTEVSLKVLPGVETTATLLINDLEPAQAVAAMTRALGSPFEVSGAAHLPIGVDGHPVTMIRVEGFENSVHYRAGALRDLLADIGTGEVETDPEQTRAGWAYVRDVQMMKGRTGDVWRIHCKPSDAVALASRLNAEAVQFDWGGGLIWALTTEGTDVRALLGTFDGHATLVRASGDTRATLSTFQPEAPALAALSKGLRAKFDPRGLLNPGLMD